MPDTLTALAGLNAAHLAAAIGKLQRERPLSEEEVQRFVDANHAAERTLAMVEGRLSYGEFVSHLGPLGRMYYLALTEGQVASAAHLKELAKQLSRLASSGLLEKRQMQEAHDLFAAIAHAVNARFTSPGERLNY